MIGRDLLKPDVKAGSHKGNMHVFSKIDIAIALYSQTFNRMMTVKEIIEEELKLNN
ncbi:MAG: hypothetical protein Q7R97_02900 [Candidatus Daviesbacteria bacterium]|nr:hypothetical protein [Candidatus Daviesbacteria bacterium]